MHINEGVEEGKLDVEPGFELDVELGLELDIGLEMLRIVLELCSVERDTGGVIQPTS